MMETNEHQFKEKCLVQTIELYNEAMMTLDEEMEMFDSIQLTDELRQELKQLQIRRLYLQTACAKVHGILQALRND